MHPPKIALAPALAVALAIALAACGGSVDITPTELPNAVVNVPYSTKLAGTGKQPITWRLVAGALPPGVTLNQGSGQLGGTPSKDGKFTFTVSAEDNSTFSSATGRRDYSLTVIPELQLSVTLPPARQYAAYQATITPTGGVAPYTVNVVGLRAGMSFDAASHTLSGNPQNQQTYQVTITASDSGSPQQSKSAQATLTVRPPAVTIATAALPQGQLNQAYDFTLQPLNGSGSFSWSVDDGLLPSGLRLETTGQLHGTPTAATDPSGVQIVIKVEDLSSTPDQDSKTFNLIVTQ